ncbi:MAG: haloacid dehalogenase-like hydrolase [Xanthomonadales bacterium]|nr:haloacid dehalogenase-like hydrolase [Xanthomonadales bacterium]ODU92380.1 MAG: haloacid dehalogenase [Rhodanobacter sp. SCN 66-43]OJY85921.1 MAG: haloacid dehalogenase [Xanthomonadales bacterium 66-474]
MQQGATGGTRRVVLFDFDGVLIHGDTFGGFVRDRYARGWWRKALLLLAAPWLLLAMPFSRRTVLRTLVRVGLLGLSEARYRELAGTFAAALVHRPRQFSREGLQALRRHVAAGDRVLIVTGCEDTLVRGVLEGLGVEGVEVLASRLQAGWFGVRSAWHNIGPRKVESLARHGIDAWQLAYSDSSQDLPMLALAVEAVLVNATPRSCMRVEKALGRSVTRVEWY